RSLGGWSYVEMNFVDVWRIIFAQPSVFVGGPDIEIMRRFTREHLFAKIGPQRVKIILQPHCELRLRKCADVRPDKSLVQKADNQRRMIGNEQPPRWVPPPERFERAIIHRAHRR